MNQARLARLGELLEESVAKNEIAGGNLCVVYQGKEVYYAQAGYANINKGIKIERDTLFRMYSMSKPITATAVMLLVERGVIDLLDPIGKFIPGFMHMKVATPSGDVAANRPITVKDCMNMTSGLTYGYDLEEANQDIMELYREVDERLYSEEPMTTLEFAHKLGKCRLVFQPGEQWRYGTSADVLGAVVEVASGMKYSEFLKKEFFEPLGMNDTDFRVASEARSRLATAYEETENGLIEYHGNHLGICNHMDTKIAFESGGAGLVSTIEDYKKFAQMLLQNGSYEGRQYLAPKTVEFMTTARLLPHQQKDLNWDNLPGFTYGNLLRIMTDTSLGVLNGSLGEYGWDGWLGPYLSNMPKEDVTFLLMVQKTGAGTFTLTRKLRNALAAAL